MANREKEYSLSRTEKLAHAQQKLKEFQRDKARKQSDHYNLSLPNGYPAYSTAAKVASQNADKYAFPGKPSVADEFSRSNWAATPPPKPVSGAAESRARSLADYFGGHDDSGWTGKGDISVGFVTALQTSTADYHPSSLVPAPGGGGGGGTAFGQPHSLWTTAGGEGARGEPGLEAVKPSHESASADLVGNGSKLYNPPSGLNADDVDPSSQVSDLTTVSTETTEKVMQLSSQLDGILRTSEYLLTSSSSSWQPSALALSTATTPFVAVPSSTTSVSPVSVMTQQVGQEFDTPWSSTPMTAVPHMQQSNYVRDLETRNVELAALLERQNRLHDRALAKLSASQERATRTASEAAAELSRLQLAAQRDLAKAQEQIRAQAQTIGALVAEKTELRSTTAHLQRLAEQRTKEIEEIDKRLQSLRQQNVELERSVGTCKAELDRRLSTNTELTNQVERSRTDVARERQLRESLEHELSEARSRLTAKAQEVAHLELSVSELQRRLEMSQIYANQSAGHSPAVTTANHVDSESRMQEEGSLTRLDWMTERAEMTARLHELESVTGQMDKDRSRLEAQYRQFVSQMELQNSELRDQLFNSNQTRNDLEVTLDAARKALREKDDEIARCKSSLVVSIAHQPEAKRPEEEGEGKSTTAAVGESSGQSALADLTEQVTNLQAELCSSLAESEKLRTEVVELQRDLLATRLQVKEKEDLLADREVVLQTAVSEKNTLSRAVEQNRALKQQLIELQDAFVAMSNKSMELTTQLEHEVHNHSLLTVALANAEARLAALLPGHQNKEEEWTPLTTSEPVTSAASPVCSADLLLSTRNEHHHQASSLPDSGCGHHVEERDTAGTLIPGGVDPSLLASELYRCHTTIEAMSVRVDQLQAVQHRLRHLLVWLQQQDEEHLPPPADSRTGDSQLEHQFDQEDPEALVVCLEHLIRRAVVERYAEVARQAKANQELHHREQEELASLRLAYTQLEAKFLDCMSRLSGASEERNRLEEMVGQLQMEASSVGECVTLFAHRRAEASRRAKAREQLLARLVQDRRRLRSALEGVQTIARQLVEAKDQPAVTETSDHHHHDSIGAVTTSLLEQVNHFLEAVAAPDRDEEQAGQELANDELNDEIEVEGVEAYQLRTPADLELVNWEHLQRQALQHDCPHCKCCVGSLLQV